MSAGIVVLTKVPTPGRVKTRLAADIGADRAAQLHSAMLDHTLTLAISTALPVTVSLGGDDGGVTADRLTRLGVTVERQASGDLGEKLRHAIRGPQRKVAIGSDCIVFDPQWLVSAAVATAPTVLGPSADGGYWAIAIPSHRADLRDALLTDMPWSETTLLNQTIARLEAAGAEYTLLPESFDVDTATDLSRLLHDPRCPASIHKIIRSA